jgi:hypothetical protein
MAYITLSGTTATLANTVLISNSLSAPSNTAETGVFYVRGHFLVVAGNPVDTKSDVIHVMKPVFNEVYMGVAKSAPSSGVVPVIQKGRTGALYSGLTFGRKYRFNLDGTINENGVVPGGTAISTTELLLD